MREYHACTRSWCASTKLVIAFKNKTYDCAFIQSSLFYLHSADSNFISTHHDGHAIATVVVSLSDFEVEYRGGLYVATGYGQKEFLPLQRGDAAIHRSFLLHGVKVFDLPDQKPPIQSDGHGYCGTKTLQHALTILMNGSLIVPRSAMPCVSNCMLRK